MALASSIRTASASVSLGFARPPVSWSHSAESRHGWKRRCLQSRAVITAGRNRRALEAPRPFGIIGLFLLGVRHDGGVGRSGGVRRGLELAAPPDRVGACRAALRA